MWASHEACEPKFERSCAHADSKADDMKRTRATPTLHGPEVRQPFASHMDDAAESRPLLSVASFEKFYSTWIEEEDALLLELKKALENPRNEQEIATIVRKCYQHFSAVMDVKIQAAHVDASYITAGLWKTPLEAGMMWMGGWRPMTGIILAYSLMGIQLENSLSELLEGISLPSMAALSAKQLTRHALRLNTVQQRTSTMEDEISNRFDVLQMLVADQLMARALTADPPPSETHNLSEISRAMEPRLVGLRDLFIEAEELRRQTLQELFAVLSPVQAAQYTMAGLEMAKAIRKLGSSPEKRLERMPVSSYETDASIYFQRTHLSQSSS